MRNNFLVVLLCFLWTFGNSQTEALNYELEDRVNEITQKQSKLIFKTAKQLPNNAQLAVALIDNGALTFYGLKREADSTVVVKNQESIFEIGSITKVFTGTLLSNYVIQNKVKLDDNINAYLDIQLKNNAIITFKQLATHTSGLPRIPPILDSISLENPYKTFGEKALKTYLTDHLTIAPNTAMKFDYSNLGVGLLGYVLGQMEHTTYENMLQRDIFSKYGMEHSTTKRDKIIDRLVHGLNDKGDTVPNWDMSVLMGAGGILSSVEDLSKFALAQFNPSNRALELARTKYFKVTESFAMGLGWSIIQTESGAEWNWHNGGTGGYTSSMIIDTKAKDGVIILSNITALGNLTELVASLCPELMKTLE